MPVPRARKTSEPSEQELLPLDRLQGAIGKAISVARARRGNMSRLALLRLLPPDPNKPDKPRSETERGPDTKYLKGIEEGRHDPSLVYLGRVAKALGMPLWRLLQIAEVEEGGP